MERSVSQVTIDGYRYPSLTELKHVLFLSEMLAAPTSLPSCLRSPFCWKKACRLDPAHEYFFKIFFASEVGFPL